jgi:hypothetical protein
VVQLKRLQLDLYSRRKLNNDLRFHTWRSTVVAVLAAAVLTV